MDPGSPLLNTQQLAERPLPSPRRTGPTLAFAFLLCRTQLMAYHALEKTHGFLSRMVDSGQRVAGAMFSECLSVEEKSRLTVRIYDFYPGYMAVGDRLHRWEEAWFERHMPKPPARILVGACGTGREAIALCERGYRVDALEPAAEFVVESRRRLGGRASVTQLSYEQLTAAVLGGVQAPGAPLHACRYDAVLLGCGSLTHVLDRTEQRRLMQALNVLCPSGPILASFFCKDDAAYEQPRNGRAIKIGRRFGRGIARLRRVELGDSNRLSYRPRSGFAYTFTTHEIEELGYGARRRVAWEPSETHPSQHATFLPPATGT